MNEKEHFSERLRAAMLRAGYATSPSVLEHEFNLRWHGRSISLQAAWSWLNNKAIPTQDKIMVLAEWLHMRPEELRFGVRIRHTVEEQEKRWAEGIHHLEQQTLDAFLNLPAPQRKIVREVILAFAQTHGSTAPAPEPQQSADYLLNKTGPR